MFPSTFSLWQLSCYYYYYQYYYLFIFCLIQLPYNGLDAHDRSGLKKLFNLVPANAMPD